MIAETASLGHFDRSDRRERSGEISLFTLSYHRKAQYQEKNNKNLFSAYIFIEKQHNSIQYQQVEKIA
ncbi:MAG: hypothetical protein D6785_13495 [Planctomycetota bacterium]|nr:MAG: hypothetical protein D6785_13495 [Planctomycetota bacterium]